MTRTIGSASALILTASVAGCAASSAGAAGPPSTAPNIASAAPANSGGAAAPLPTVSTLAPAVRPGKDAEHPVLRCGPADSYYYVATEYRCGDGSNPLGGNVVLARRLRLGNVGANSTGHIIDVYQVPCPEGPQRVFVDMYGCRQHQAPSGEPNGPVGPNTPGSFPGST